MSFTSIAASRLSLAEYGSKSLGLNGRVFFGSRLTLAISVRIADVCAHDCRPRPSAIQSSSRSVSGPGSMAQTPASS